MEQNVLVNPELIRKIPQEGFNLPLFVEKVMKHKEEINDAFLFAIVDEVIDRSLSVVNTSLVLEYDDAIDERLKKYSVKLVENYVKDPEKKECNDFVTHYNRRFDQLSSMLKNRTELEGAVSLSRLEHHTDREKAAIIGMVLEKAETKNGHLIFTLEDRTGTMKVLVGKNNEVLYKEAQDVMLDEVIGVVGTLGEEILFAESFLYPDVPLHKPLKKSPYDHHAVFISDIHFGSKMFKKEEFSRFIRWINGEVGSEEQKKAARRVKYLFIAGDVVDGVGIFPSQEQDVAIKDIYLQYDQAYQYISKVRKDLCIIICPGNHDPMRIAEPQPMHYKDYAKKLYELENVVFVSSPSTMMIDVSEEFEGIEVLLYHGFSIPFYADQVPSIRKAGGMKRVDLVLEYYLRRRHFAPTHASTQFIPDTDYDHLVIGKVPDILATGHIHRYTAVQYRNVTCLNCSCWLSLTDYQIKLGIESQPCRAILVDLATRKVQVLKFGQDETEAQKD